MHKLKKNIFKKIKDHLKSIGPIIAVILLVVIAVILITVILSFGKGFTNKSLDKAKDIKDISESDAELFTYPKQFSDGVVQFNYSPPNNIPNDILITGYKIFSDNNETMVVSLSNNYTLKSGSNALNLNDFSDLNITDNKIDIQLITSDGEYIVLKNLNNPIDTTQNGAAEPLETCTSGGIGTLVDPIIVCTAEDIDNIRNGLDANYMLGRDIDFFNPAHWVSPPTNIATTTANWNSGAGFIPIGTNVAKFIGSLDGNNHKISHLYINRSTTDFVGLLGYTNYGFISDINLEDVNIVGQNYVGALIGNMEYGTITNSHSTNTVSGSNIVGGLVGLQTYGTISNCSSSANVSGTGTIGGLVGWNQAGILTYSSASGNVFGTTIAGGLVSDVMGGTVTYNFSSGNVSGTDYLGGFVGEIFGGGTISNNYSLGNVVRTSGGNTTRFGGFVGSASGTFTNNYSKGSVSGNSWTPTTKGFSGTATTGSGNYWDTTTSLQSTSASGATGKTTALMKQQATFTGWTFPGNWSITEGTTYPYLTNNPQSPLPQ